MVSELNLSKRDKILIVSGLVVIGVLLIVLLVVVRNVSRARDEREMSIKESGEIAQIQSLGSLTVTPSSTTASSKTSTASSTPTATATQDPDKNLNSARAVVSNFLEAYISRDLEQAKPYMTDTFYNSYNQADFAGVSSPSRDRFEIVSAEVKQPDAEYGVKAYVYLKLDGEDVGTSVLEFSVLKQGDRLLVSGMTET